jgi:hypothetical protein
MNYGKIPDNGLFFNDGQFLYMKGHKDIKVGEFNIEQYDRLFGDKKYLIKMFATNNTDTINMRDWYFERMLNNSEFISSINGENTRSFIDNMFCDYCYYPLHKNDGIIDDYYYYCQDLNKIMCKWCYEDNREEQIKEKHAYFERDFAKKIHKQKISQEEKDKFKIRQLKGVAISCRCCDKCGKSLCENYYHKSFNDECCQDCLDMDEKEECVYCDYNDRDYYGFGCITAWMPYYMDKLKTVFIMINVDENSPNYNKLAVAYRIENEKYGIIQVNSNELPDGIFDKYPEIIRGLYEIGLVRGVNPRCIFSYFVHNKTLLFSRKIINVKLPKRYSEIPYLFFGKQYELITEYDLIDFYQNVFSERNLPSVNFINGMNTTFGCNHYVCVGCSKNVLFPSPNKCDAKLYCCKDCEHYICDECHKKTPEEIEKQFNEQKESNFYGWEYNRINTEVFYNCLVKEKHTNMNVFEPRHIPLSCYCNYCEKKFYKEITKNLRYTFFEQISFYDSDDYDFDLCLKCAEKEECKSIMENGNFRLINEKEQNEFDYFGFGSIFDWIPILSINGYHVYLLLNCNPDSKQHGRFATFIDNKIDILDDTLEEIQEKLYNNWDINSSYNSQEQSDHESDLESLLSDSESEVGL